MSNLETINLLMDKAKSIAGSDANLARALDVKPQRIANWRNGNATCAPEDQALIAAIAGLDPIAELARATVRRHEGSKKGDMLLKALGKASLATGAAIAGVGANAQAIFSSIQTTGVGEKIVHWIRQTMCIM